MRILLRLAAVASACLITIAASAATLLPPGMQTFLDANGAPLAGGKVYFYAPGTTTLANTWQDAGQTTLNTNPVVLDASGRAVIFGTGQYREVLQDQLGNVIWDKITGDPGASLASWGGVGGGTANAQTVDAANFSSQDGQSISFIPSVTNTAAVSVNPNSVGPIPVLVDTPAGPTSTAGGELVANSIATLTYDAIRGAFHVSGISAQPGALTPLTAAATTDLGTILSHFVNLSGNATITSFGSSASLSLPIYYVEFSGGQTITAGTSLLTPGSGNITTAANDSAILEYYGSGQWQVLAYFRAAGGAVPAGAVMAFALTSCPPGWARANGNGGMVDARGVVIRGIDNGAGLDPAGNRAIGNYQADALQAHAHNFTYSYTNVQNGTSGSSYGAAIAPTNQSGTTSNAVAPVGGSSAGVAPNVDIETRMKNIALLYCEKL